MCEGVHSGRDGPATSAAAGESTFTEDGSFFNVNTSGGANGAPQHRKGAGNSAETIPQDRMPRWGAKFTHFMLPSAGRVQRTCWGV